MIFLTIGYKILRFYCLTQLGFQSRCMILHCLLVGNEVSYNEIGNLIGLNSKTVESYIQLLEKSFVVFRLNSFSRNLRNELKASKKIYFYDNGIRNAIISSFQMLEGRHVSLLTFEKKKL